MRNWEYSVYCVYFRILFQTLWNRWWSRSVPILARFSVIKLRAVLSECIVFTINTATKIQTTRTINGGKKMAANGRLIALSEAKSTFPARSRSTVYYVRWRMGVPPKDLGVWPPVNLTTNGNFWLKHKVLGNFLQNLFPLSQNLFRHANWAMQKNYIVTVVTEALLDRVSTSLYSYYI